MKATVTNNEKNLILDGEFINTEGSKLDDSRFEVSFVFEDSKTGETLEFNIEEHRKDEIHMRIINALQELLEEK